MFKKKLCASIAVALSIAAIMGMCTGCGTGNGSGSTVTDSTVTIPTETDPEPIGTLMYSKNNGEVWEEEIYEPVDVFDVKYLQEYGISDSDVDSKRYIVVRYDDGTQEFSQCDENGFLSYEKTLNENAVYAFNRTPEGWFEVQYHDDGTITDKYWNKDETLTSLTHYKVVDGRGCILHREYENGTVLDIEYVSDDSAVMKHYQSVGGTLMNIDCVWDGNGNETENIVYVTNRINGTEVTYTQEQIQHSPNAIYFHAPKANECYY